MDLVLGHRYIIRWAENDTEIATYIGDQRGFHCFRNGNQFITIRPSSAQIIPCTRSNNRAQIERLGAHG